MTPHSNLYAEIAREIATVLSKCPSQPVSDIVLSVMIQKGIIGDEGDDENPPSVEVVGPQLGERGTIKVVALNSRFGPRTEMVFRRDRKGSVTPARLAA